MNYNMTDFEDYCYEEDDLFSKSKAGRRAKHNRKNRVKPQDLPTKKLLQRKDDIIKELTNKVRRNSKHNNHTTTRKTPAVEQRCSIATNSQLNKLGKQDATIQELHAQIRQAKVEEDWRKDFGEESSDTESVATPSENDTME
jgi:hypothetical protein